MRKCAIAVSAVMFGAPFLLLAYRYEALPAEMPVFRNPLLHAMIFAPKSAFTVFRVPLMNLSHGLTAGVMVSRSGDFKEAERRAGYWALFSTLLHRGVEVSTSRRTGDKIALTALFALYLVIVTASFFIGRPA